MAANFQQHMGGGPGQMMPQQQRQQQQQQQRPPQNQNQNPSAQVQNLIYTTLTQQTGPLTGWQAGVLINERIGLIFNIIGNLRLAAQHQPNPPNLNRMMEIAIRFEKDIFDKSPNKETYKHEVQMKLEQLLERRNQNQASLQQSINQQAQAQAQAQQAQAQAQQMMMNQNSMQGQVSRQIPQQPTQQGFQHLQHQMQASPLPGQQPQPQAQMGMPHQGLPPNMTANQQQQFQMSLQQAQQAQAQQNLAGRPQNAQPPLSQQDHAIVNDLANRLMANASAADKEHLRTTMQERMDPQAFQRCQAQNIDPLMLFYRNQAAARLRQEKQARMAQMTGGQMPQQDGRNIPSAAPPMVQQRSMNPSPLNGQTQPPTSTGGNTDFGSFMGNMENLNTQQQQGVMAQEAGQMVVPVSGGPRNGTPQPGVMPGQPMNMNDQRGMANPNARTQQQQVLNAQQMQQQRMQHAQQQQQQSQIQARLNAQAKAQQIALQGQPGGMGPGPIPPQPSPAMATLNAPMRTPSQQMSHPEPPQVNPSAQFGQPLDPRFMQGNQRQPGQGNAFNVAGLNPAIFANMGPEAQQRLAGLPPEKLNEVVSKWHEQRAQQMNASNMQAGRPQMPMQPNGQVRPGQQIPQVGQFNPQNAANQFMMGNTGQRAPQAIAGGMNPQQQMLLQQQMAALRPTNQIPQRTPAQNMMANTDRIPPQMDGFEIPPMFRNHNSMPQGVPPEVKKWGQLKQWISQNPTMGNESLDAVKTLQRLHYANVLRQRSQQQIQVGMMQPGVQGGQVGMPAVPPGMAAPVAPMGQHPMQMANGLNMPGPGQMRQPTPQEIQSLRNHPSGKMANATDDQIRAVWMRNQAQAQMTPQQQQQRQQLMQIQQMNRMAQAQAQAAGQQPPHAGQVQQNANSMGSAQGVQGQGPQAKQPQSGPEAALTSGNRASKQQPHPRNAAQNSSPAQPPKSLKRASSDDVVEVPNPNTQQARPTSQQTQGSKQPNQQPRPNLSRDQIAAMDPESRKKYEAMVRMSQMNQSNQTNRPTQIELQEKLKTILTEEQEKSRDPLPDIPMDPETKAATEQLLGNIVQPLNNVGKVVSRWFLVTFDEVRARAFYRAHLRLAKQFRDAQMTQLKDSFSISPKEIESSRQLLNSIIADLTAKFPNMKKPDAAKAQPPPAAQPTAAVSQSGTTQGMPTPLNAANLQQQQQQLNKMHQRANSRSSQTPAAPTQAQAPFNFNSRSPIGGPSYIGKGITQNDLHIPARKKQKPNNSTPVLGQTTPGSTTSPQVTKEVTPEVKRQLAESKPQVKPSLCCSEPECERHNLGFDSEEALKQHTQEEHIRPLENPGKYAQENLASVLGLNSQGQSKKPATTTQDSAAAPSAANMVSSASKQGQTPNIKGENTSIAGTPMNRQVSMNRQASAAGGKLGAPSKSNLGKDSPAKSHVGRKDINKQSQPQPEATISDPWANATIDPHDLLQSFQPFETGAGGAISDVNVYRSITPNDTPESSKDGVSEPNSDISEGVNLDINVDIFDDSWMPFGPSETDALLDLSSFSVNPDEDMSMFDIDQPLVNYQQWDDVDTSFFDKPFSFDNSLYSMQAD